MSDVERKYLIWSVEHGAWWKPNSMGYTHRRIEAGIYSEEEAMEICDKANIGRETPHEVMLPIWQVKND